MYLRNWIRSKQSATIKMKYKGIGRLVPFSLIEDEMNFTGGYNGKISGRYGETRDDKNDS